MFPSTRVTEQKPSKQTTFLRTDFSDFFLLSLLNSPYLTWMYWVVCELWCRKWARSPPEVSSNLTRRVSQQHTKGKGSTLTLPPFSSRSLMVSSSPLLSCDLCGGHWENRHYVQLAVRYLKAELLRWRLQIFHLYISTLLFPPYDMKTPIENNKNKLWPWHFKHTLLSQ